MRRVTRAGAESSCERGEAQGSRGAQAQQGYAEHPRRPSNEVSRSKSAQNPLFLYFFELGIDAVVTTRLLALGAVPLRAGTGGTRTRLCARLLRRRLGVDR